MTPQLQTRGPFSWAALLWVLLYFWFFSTALQIFILATGYSGTNGLRDSLLYSSLWLIPVFLFPARTRLLAAVIGIILWLGSIGALAYFVIYGQEFSQSVLFVMFETNKNEASEFASQYLSLKLLAILLMYSAAAIFLWTRLRPVYLRTPWRYGVVFGILYGLILHPLISDLALKKNSVSTAVNHLSARMEPAAPWQLISSYVQYRKQLSALENMLTDNSALPPLVNLKDSSGDAPRTLVLVIGESTQRNRMSLYGYARKTTPQLDSLRDHDPGFTLFKDVVTTRPYTIEILQQALTFADQENPDRYLTQPSLMNMMKQAGYKTFWITNQQTMTARNTMLTVFSRQTDKQYYMNQQRTQSAREYDANVFAPFRDALADSAPKKFIIVHLLGTHIKYKYRYPEQKQWTLFNGKTSDIPPGLSQEQQETYNDYDNANLYNDNVLATLISDYKATDPNGFMLYFSDHGEEVYDTPPHDIQGRNEAKPTRAMYTVPFFIWTSDKWKAAHPRDFTGDVYRKFSLMNLIYTWSDLAGLSYDGYDPTRSLVNPAFVQTTRWIGDPYKKNGLHDFDALTDGEAIKETGR
ncbi:MULTISPECIES: phosphoethanolamine transferase CptA [Tenebrionibacter/Tenebrionicola group]|jgi:heptose-I-phosphate ethanolaminephosphotransferase|uniref:Phosphoethanolamine transferase CptA n=2 Tax=Tenebrionibacter/Tenebrionicola group TaxID=2969848 RepID=A0A8K0Y096_9ENTR|nr:MULTISPECIES: phosphoethanolamine transferase CptA [Tenebrionibacter/Tenebrionicola group]MBK4716404.1 phosphoethanolamine transferase CptA [Tenebrionibacter intestinalis]MBV4414235.1 phosphoethanolamine transferase CptA [Tenebrionicola larvae]MBV5096539.1 phosphoethanolamine transferase CptA [Tenebrionicola larvae]